MSDLTSNAYALFSTGAGDQPGGWSARDVQERWGERKGEWDEREREAWKGEWEMRRAREGAQAQGQGHGHEQGSTH